MLWDTFNILGASLPQKEHHRTWKGDAGLRMPGQSRMHPLTPHSMLQYQKGLPAVHLVELTALLSEAAPHEETACSS